MHFYGMHICACGCLQYLMVAENCCLFFFLKHRLCSILFGVLYLLIVHAWDPVEKLNSRLSGLLQKKTEYEDY